MPQRNQKWLIALAVVLLGGMLLFLICATPPAFPAVTILPPGPLVVKSGRAPDRWIPAEWTWLRRACRFVMGPLRQVGFHIQIIESSATVGSIVSQNFLGQPQAESNGLAVWIVPVGSLEPLKGAATSLSAPGITTADGMRATVGTSMGTSGFSADFFPLLEHETVNLSTRLIVTSSGQTNFVAAVHAHLPYGQALFVLDVRQPESATNRYEFLITADKYDAKGNKVHRHP
jgi:hypothetical protein